MGGERERGGCARSSDAEFVVAAPLLLLSLQNCGGDVSGWSTSRGISVCVCVRGVQYAGLSLLGTVPLRKADREEESCRWQAYCSTWRSFASDCSVTCWLICDAGDLDPCEAHLGGKSNAKSSVSDSIASRPADSSCGHGHFASSGAGKNESKPILGHHLLVSAQCLAMSSHGLILL
ncbi:hypothetical protein U1Q18_039912 [Sarracenia purpurea var. burkii]